MDRHSQRVVLSTVGASIATNNTSRDFSERVRKQANAQTLTPDLAGELEQHLEDIAIRMINGALEVSAIRRLSAELNGLFAFYEGDLRQGARDQQILIATDTVVGRGCAAVVRRFLESRGLKVIVEIPPGLNTSSTEAFSSGIKELIYWCDTTLRGYRDQQYQILFNLVGAFKAVQGYLNTIGMFYADAMLYLFEGEDQPIIIPRLPIRIDQTQIHDHASVLALLAENRNDGIPLDLVVGLADTFYEAIDGLATITDWGELTWAGARRDIYREQLLTFPRLTYAPSFEKDVERHRKEIEHIVDLQATLAQLSLKMLQANGDTSVLKGGKAGGLLAQEFKGKPINGEPSDHLRLTQEYRIVFQSDHKGGLILYRFGPEKELY